MHSIRLIALDLDQTLFGTDLVVSPRVQQSIGRAIRSGATITIATGRDKKLADRFARELGVTAPVICSQGCCIYDHLRQRVLHETRLAPTLLPGILQAAHHFAWNIHFEVADQLFFPSHSNHPQVMFELLRYSNWVRVGDLLQAMTEPPHKFIVTLNEPEDRERVVGEMRGALGSALTILPSHPHLVEALPAGVDKGHGLAWLAGHLGIPEDHVLAIGDSEADVPMLQWAAIGVAMGNGSDAAKAAADWIAPTLEQDGAAVAIERFGLGEAGLQPGAARGVL
jgi:Cof subfamily protein (haloacid dehalogenase superfamily)